MKSVNLISSNDKTVRTQITLTKKLKKLVEQSAQKTGKSLSEYLRKAALARLLVETKEKQDLELVARRVVGSVKLDKHPEWKTKKQTQYWIRSLRQEW